MRQGTFKVSINGARNLMAALVAAGYKGGAGLNSVLIINKNAVPLYINLTDTGLSAPAAPINGMPIGTGETSTQYQLSNTGTIDAGLTWLYSASAIDAIITVVGC